MLAEAWQAEAWQAEACRRQGCGHPRSHHDHYDGGIYCAVPYCGCRAFRRPRRRDRMQARRRVAWWFR